MLERIINSYFLLLPYNQAGVVAAMVWGYKKGLNPDIYNAFRQTGTLHLLVLSGQNISLLIGAVTTLLYIKKYYKALISIAIALLYLFAVSKDPPIIRAVFMVVLGSTAFIIGAHAYTAYLLLLSFLFSLILFPQWITSVSFQLSYAATAGIILFYPFLKLRYKKKFSVLLYNAFALSFSAFIFTAPILLIAFRQLSLIGVITNVVIGLFVEPIMVIGLLLPVLSIMPPPIAQITAYLLSPLVSIMLWLITKAAQFSPLFTISI